jgi:hypothetical protein
MTRRTTGAAERRRIGVPAICHAEVMIAVKRGIIDV